MLVIDLASRPNNYDQLIKRFKIKFPPCCVADCPKQGKYWPIYKYNHANTLYRDIDIQLGFILINDHAYCSKHRYDEQVKEKFQASQYWQQFKAKHLPKHGIKIREQDSWFDFMHIVTALALQGHFKSDGITLSNG